MKTLAFIFLLSMCFTSSLLAQDIAMLDTAIAEKLLLKKAVNTGSEIVFVPNTMIPPTFEAGEQALIDFIQTHLDYPEMARKYEIEGTVILEFRVAVDGSIQQVKVLKKLGYGLDEEALRLLKLLPKWKAGQQGAFPVSTKVTMPIEFSLL